jgi:hypothetical protein
MSTGTTIITVVLLVILSPAILLLGVLLVLAAFFVSVCLFMCIASALSAVSDWIGKLFRPRKPVNVILVPRAAKKK